MRPEVRQRIHAEAAYRVGAYPADMDRALGVGMEHVRRRLIRTWAIVIAGVLALTAALVAVRVFLAQEPATLQTIAVSAPASSLRPEATVRLSAEGTYSDGSRRTLGEGVAWASENPEVADVTPNGEATAVATGVAAVTATFDGVSGRFELTVTAPGTATLTSVRINPGEASVDVGGKVELTAEGTYSDGSLGKLDVTAFWASDNQAVARVDGNGLVTAVAPGSATISASEGEFRGTSKVTVTTPPPARITGLAIDPAAATIPQGQTRQFTAVASYSDGTSQPVTDVTWSANPGNAATVSASGSVTARSPGQTLIEAIHVDGEGKQWKAQSKVDVVHAVVAVVVSPAGPHALEPGQTLQLGAKVTYTDGKPGNPDIKWASSRPIFVSVSPAGLVRGGTRGQATITATVDGVSSNPVTVTVGPLAPTPGPVG
ncbi:Ig-like domain-containing protein [Paenarthrobacter sp. NPDC089322]|uniref:Ig-like domain-containing protein n=1 Tax=Paenarthrobacter sp. NPDC089322 TaxID=3155065 RepID=UPI0034203189